MLQSRCNFGITPHATSKESLTETPPRVEVLKHQGRDYFWRLVRSRDRILIVLLRPLSGPNDRLYVSVLVYAEDHALFNLSLRTQVNAAIVFHLDPHFRGWL